MYFLSKELFFPPARMANEDGLLAIGGDLSVERLLLAYRNGIFPWYNEDEPICWYCPDPRFVLFPPDLNISNSMRTTLNKGIFSFTVNKEFAGVVKNCKNVHRKGQNGTWISDAIMDAYLALHQLGYAHSAEAWCNGELAGGLYGIRIGRFFFGESMFSKQSNASKFALIKYARYLQKQGTELIDCQVYTPHLDSLGAKMIDRDVFLTMLKELNH